MKKWVFAIVFALGLSCVGQAQTIEKKIAKALAEGKRAIDWDDWQWGLRAGLNWASVTDEGGSKARTAYHIGGYGFYKFHAKWAIRPEVVLSSQGYKNTKGDEKFVFDPLYLNFPISVEYFVASNCSLYAGPQFGLVLDKGLSEKSPLRVNTFELGLDVGATYYADKNWNLDLRYTYGLTRVFDSGHHNSVFHIGIGYTF